MAPSNPYRQFGGISRTTCLRAGQLLSSEPLGVKVHLLVTCFLGSLCCCLYRCLDHKCDADFTRFISLCASFLRYLKDACSRSVVSFCLATMAAQCINQYTDPEVEVKDGKVTSCVPSVIRHNAATVTFFPVLKTSVLCGLDNRCRHPKYGLHVPSNHPCVFDGHKRGEPAYYLPFSSHCTAPFREPAVGDTLITGIKWNTRTPRDRQVAVTNSCMLDGFLTDLKIRSLDVKFCFECLFTHSSGPGRDLERCLRTIVFHILVQAKPIARSQYQRIRVFSYEDDLKIKRIWLDKDAMALVPQYNENTGNEEQNLLYRKRRGKRLSSFLFSFSKARCSCEKTPFLLFCGRLGRGPRGVIWVAICYPSEHGSSRLEKAGHCHTHQALLRLPLPSARCSRDTLLHLRGPQGQADCGPRIEEL